MLTVFLLCICIPVSAFSFSSLINSIKNLFSSDKHITKEIDEDSPLILPDIPESKDQATNQKYYDQKIEKLYPGGKKFFDLSVQERQVFYVSFVQELYEVILGRDIHNDELSKWVNVLSSGGAREGVYRALILGDEYRMLEEKNEAFTKTKVKDFCVEYLKKYLHQEIAPEIWPKLNPSMLKRAILEKTLDMMEDLQLKPKDLFTWYAIFSKDVAERFPQIWESSLRKNSNEKLHYEWAEHVPLQHIKSETIIKLAKIINQI